VYMIRQRMNTGSDMQTSNDGQRRLVSSHAIWRHRKRASASITCARKAMLVSCPLGEGFQEEPYVESLSDFQNLAYIR
jgi:hypothetical protein